MKNNNKLLSVIKLSIPALLMQLAYIVMDYIDSSMVGQLGEDASASIGVVSTSVWLFADVMIAVATGFGVLIAHKYGAKEYKSGRIIFKNGLIYCLSFSLILMIIGISISYVLPIILRAPEAIRKNASWYFFIFSLSLPFSMLNTYSATTLQCSGNMITPSILNALVCLLDILLNLILIPHFGVIGAGIGTALATTIISIFMFCFCALKKNELNIFINDNFKFDWRIVKESIKISGPIAFEQVAICGAMITTTSIIAPLGSISLAAHSFAITVESISYSIGVGVSRAATTLVGLSIGAKDYKGAKTYGNIAVILGAMSMGIVSIGLYFICPYIFMFLTPVQDVRILATKVLRFGLIAEPFLGTALISSGALRGADDTLIPSIVVLISIWLVRIPLAIFLVSEFGLLGLWIANSVELIVRGILLLVRQLTSKHYKERKEEVLLDS